MIKLPANGKVTYTEETRTLTLTGTSEAENVMHVDADDFTDASIIDISVPLNSWTTINVGGPSPNLERLAMTLAPTTVLQKV